MGFLEEITVISQKIFLTDHRSPNKLSQVLGDAGVKNKTMVILDVAFSYYGEFSAYWHATCHSLFHIALLMNTLFSYKNMMQSN